MLAETHTQRRLRPPYPDGWVAYVSHEQAERLVVFVHGFQGNATGTWRSFQESGTRSDWWRKSDLLFVSYNSVRDTITGAATRIRTNLPKFYPVLPDDVTQIGGLAIRQPSRQPYTELRLVGHSLGGVVLRHMLYDLAQSWLDAQQNPTNAVPRPGLLDAKLRLFSPASAGFRSAGWLGLVQATGLWAGVNMYLRHSSAYTDLQPGSDPLENVRRRTEAAVNAHRTECGALRAAILWANPDDVVVSERYDTDFVADTVDGTSHSSVCKPSLTYERPWEFVES